MMEGKIDVVDPAVILKLVLAVALGGIIISGMIVRPPRRTFPRKDLRTVVVAAFGLYAVGFGASLSHHVTVAMLVYATGIAFSTFAAWLSRGRDTWNPPPDENPGDWPPPGGPEEFDWDAFERELGDYMARRNRPLTPVH